MAERLHTNHPVDQSDHSGRRRRFELFFASVWLAVGFFVVPALVFWVGIVALGPYGEGQGAGLGTFYDDFFGHLANGEVRTWSLALGPLILISLIRALYIGTRPSRPHENSTSSLQPPAAKPSDHRRVEPRITE